LHKIANVLGALPKSAHPGAKKALAEIWNAEDKDHARMAVKAFAAAYGAKFPKATAKITEDEAELLAFFDYPAEHWVHLRTTNPIVILSFPDDHWSDLGVRGEDGVAGAVRAGVCAGCAGADRYRRATGRVTGGCRRPTVCVALRWSPSACASWRRSRVFSSASCRLRWLASASRRSREASEARCEAGIGGDGARWVVSRRRSISARMSL